MLTMKSQTEGIWILISLIIIAIMMSLPCPTHRTIAAPQEPITEEGLRIGEPFHIYYGIPGLGFGGTLPNATNLHALIYTDPMSEPQALPMKENNGIWEGVYTLQDTTVKMILIEVAEIDSLGVPVQGKRDNNYNKYWDVLVLDQSGNPVEGAFEARALSYTGYGGKRQENLELAIEEITEELKRFPHNYSARMLDYTIRLKQNAYASATRRRISANIESFIETDKVNAEAIQFAISAYRMIGENQKADE